MNDLDSALDDVIRLREQLTASSRFQGFAPPIVALTGLMAFALAAWQSWRSDTSLVAWILLAALSALMIGTEAIVRARRLHRAMASRLLNMTLERFLPTAATGAIVGLVIVLKAPEHARILPGLWQLLLGIGIFAMLSSLPRQMFWAAIFYFIAGTLSLFLGVGSGFPTMWLMGLSFGVGQLLVAGILHFATTTEAVHDRED